MSFALKDKTLAAIVVESGANPVKLVVEKDDANEFGDDQMPRAQELLSQMKSAVTYTMGITSTKSWVGASSSSSSSGIPSRKEEVTELEDGTPMPRAAVELFACLCECVAGAKSSERVKLLDRRLPLVAFIHEVIAAVYAQQAMSQKQDMEEFVFPNAASDDDLDDSNHHHNNTSTTAATGEKDDDDDEYDDLYTGDEESRLMKKQAKVERQQEKEAAAHLWTSENLINSTRRHRRGAGAAAGRRGGGLHDTEQKLDEHKVPPSIEEAASLLRLLSNFALLVTWSFFSETAKTVAKQSSSDFLAAGSLSRTTIMGLRRTSAMETVEEDSFISASTRTNVLHESLHESFLEETSSKSAAEKLSSYYNDEITVPVFEDDNISSPIKGHVQLTRWFLTLCNLAEESEEALIAALLQEIDFAAQHLIQNIMDYYEGKLGVSVPVNNASSNNTLFSSSGKLGDAGRRRVNMYSDFRAGNHIPVLSLVHPLKNGIVDLIAALTELTQTIRPITSKKRLECFSPKRKRTSSSSNKKKKKKKISATSAASAAAGGDENEQEAEEEEDEEDEEDEEEAGGYDTLSRFQATTKAQDEDENFLKDQIDWSSNLVVHRLATGIITLFLERVGTAVIDCLGIALQHDKTDRVLIQDEVQRQKQEKEKRREEKKKMKEQQNEEGNNNKEEEAGDDNDNDEDEDDDEDEKAVASVTSRPNEDLLLRNDVDGHFVKECCNFIEHQLTSPSRLGLNDSVVEAMLPLRELCDLLSLPQNCYQNADGCFQSVIPRELVRTFVFGSIVQDIPTLAPREAHECSIIDLVSCGDLTHGCSNQTGYRVETDGEVATLRWDSAGFTPADCSGTKFRKNIETCRINAARTFSEMFRGVAQSLYNPDNNENNSNDDEEESESQSESQS